MSEADEMTEVQRIVYEHAAEVGRPFNRCKRVSLALADDLKRHGVDAEVIRCSYLLEYAPKADKRWLDLGSQMYWTHYVVRVDDQVIDLTRRQFFPKSELPFVQDYADFAREWEEIGRYDPELEHGLPVR